MKAEGTPPSFQSDTTSINEILEIVQIEKEVFDAMLERVAYLHNMIHTLFEKMRDKGNEDWLTLKEVCQILNISERKVRNLQYGGKIGFVKHGKKSCYKAADIYAIAMGGVRDDE